MNAQNGFNAALWNCALECALKRRNKKCKNKFGSMICAQCKFNIANYADADPRHLQLFMLTAEQEADMRYWKHRMPRPLFAAAIVACLLIAWFMHVSRPKTVPQAQVIKPVNQKVSTKQTDIQQIKETLKLVDRDLRKKIDVNGDGLINCIYAAVLFYQYYPDKKKCYITWNKDNPKVKDFNHLFNSVLIDGTWRAIEPQAAYMGEPSFYVRDVWPSQYDSNYNTSATGIYGKYAKVK